MTHPFRWNGEAMESLRPKDADREFVIGQTYWLTLEEPRSEASHRQFFAFLREAWLQLPDDVAELYPSPEHLRKRALIDCGFYHEEIVDVGTKAGALRVAAFARHEDEFAHVVVRGSLVVVRKAKSQRMHGRDSMKKADFQASKDAVMEKVAAMINVSPEELQRNAGRAA